MAQGPSEGTPSRHRPGDLLRHPLVLAMLTLWIVNDHVLKGLLANDLTGKLSDVASLAVFPLIPYATYEIGCGLMGRPARHALGILLVSIFATGAVMVGINISDAWAEAYRVGLGLCQWPFRWLGAWFTGGSLPGPTAVQLTMDPSDAWTLPALYIPLWVFRRTRPKQPTP